MQDVGLVAGVVGVVVNGVGNVAVPVNFFKGDFPFVVAFDPVEGHHWVQGPLEPLFLGVNVGPVQLVVAVHQEVARNFWISNP